LLGSRDICHDPQRLQHVLDCTALSSYYSGEYRELCRPGAVEFDHLTGRKTMPPAGGTSRKGPFSLIISGRAVTIYHKFPTRSLGAVASSKACIWPPPWPYLPSGFGPQAR
jgi:hypothetical protein